MKKPNENIRLFVRFLKEFGLYITYLESIKKYGYKEYPVFNYAISLPSFINRSFTWSSTGYENLWKKLFFITADHCDKENIKSIFDDEDLMEMLRNEIKKII